MLDLNNDFSLTISISAYNDAISLKTLVEELQILLEGSKNINILIINDGSSDNTMDVINDLVYRFKNIEYLSHEINLGFGYTIKEAITHPTSDFVLYLSGDNQFPAKNLLLFINSIGINDYVLGIRDKREDDFYRKVISIGYNILISIVARKIIRDVNSIFLVKKEVLKKVNLTSKIAFIHAELFIKLWRNGIIMDEIICLHQKRKYGQGQGGTLKTIFTTFYELIKFSIKSGWNRNLLQQDSN